MLRTRTLPNAQVSLGFWMIETDLALCQSRLRETTFAAKLIQGRTLGLAGGDGMPR